VVTPVLGYRRNETDQGSRDACARNTRDGRAVDMIVPAKSIAAHSNSDIGCRMRGPGRTASWTDRQADIYTCAKPPSANNSTPVT
jgi:hypothetical protein